MAGLEVKKLPCVPAKHPLEGQINQDRLPVVSTRSVPVYSSSKRHTGVNLGSLELSSARCLRTLVQVSGAPSPHKHTAETRFRNPNAQFDM